MLTAQEIVEHLNEIDNWLERPELAYAAYNTHLKGRLVYAEGVDGDSDEDGDYTTQWMLYTVDGYTELPFTEVNSLEEAESLAKLLGFTYYERH